ncbi:MAG: DUF547 domain-containing protein [Planctomycetota bacterium]|nr:MAG: DUF547 domain-containing protein [Planctomycetota bacterium]
MRNDVMRFGFYTALIPLIAVFVGTGCGPTSIMPRLEFLGDSPTHTYRDWDWARVLGSYVKDGLVDYEQLSSNPEPLHRFYALLSVSGPSRTPDHFTNRNQVIAYWINAYNALVLVAVLSQYPTTTMYDLSLPRLEYEYSFNVDGKWLTLTDIEDEIFELSNGDVRTLLALNRAALGGPRLHERPLRATVLDRQLDEVAAQALDDPGVMRIDHMDQSILLWQLILRRESDFVKYLRNRRRVRTAYLYNVLLELASPARKEKLQGAVGYLIRPMSFDRMLNSRSSRYRRPVVP